MANTIELAKKCVTMLDEVYKRASVTSILDGSPDLVREGANVNEMIIPMLKMDGLADYSRNDGYTSGDVELTWETVKCNFDRGRGFSVDAMDDQESAGVAFGMLAGEFERTAVVPEVDAFRLAKYTELTGSAGKKEETLADGKAVLAAIRAGATLMDEAEVPKQDRYLFITPTLLGMVQDLDTTASREVLQNFTGIFETPQSRFYTAIQQYSGKDGEKKGGYAKATGAADINFMIIHKPAVIQFPKHVVPRIFTPEQNIKSDGWLFNYRNVGIADAYQNKLAGIYVSHKPVG